MTEKLSISIISLFISILFCAIFPINGLAVEKIVVDSTSSNTTSSQKSDNSIAEEDESFFSFFDGSYSYISSNVESLAQGLDEYISSDRVEYKNSGTLLRLREEMIWSESDGIKLKSDIRFRLRLPGSRKKTRLVFQTNARDDSFFGSDDNSVSSIAFERESEEYSAESQSTLEEQSSWKFRPSIGAYLGTTSDIYVKFRVNKQQSFGRWSINWEETPYFVDSTGWGLDSYFEINRKIAEHDLFRSTTFAGWSHDTGYFELNQFFSMNHRLNSKSAISYFTGVYGITEPEVHTTEYLYGINYRRNLHKNYLFLEVKPEVKHREINRFEPEHSLIFRFEILFNK